VLIKACLNGNRKAEEHSALPLFPDELGWDGRRVVEGGPALYLHPQRSDGSEMLEANDVGAAREAVHTACPNVPAGVSTGAWIESDVGRRVRLISSREVPRSS
jgi:uncharacterized protein (DUF849 family)